MAEVGIPPMGAASNDPMIQDEPRLEWAATQLKRVSVRRATLSECPCDLSDEDISVLAKCGFYYTFDGERAKCLYCGEEANAKYLACRFPCLCMHARSGTRRCPMVAASLKSKCASMNHATGSHVKDSSLPPMDALMDAVHEFAETKATASLTINDADFKVDHCHHEHEDLLEGMDIDREDDEESVHSDSTESIIENYADLMMAMEISDEEGDEGEEPDVAPFGWPFGHPGFPKKSEEIISDAGILTIEENQEPGAETGSPDHTNNVEVAPEDGSQLGSNDADEESNWWELKDLL